MRIIKSQLDIKDFAALILNIIKTDRDVITACSGFTGEGKSTFLIQLLKAYFEILGQPWDMKSFITWERVELLKWIDGLKGEADAQGLKPGQLPEYSGILADELFNMFYKRNWYESGQIDAIATFNMCRDRHLFVCGNVPGFFDLDPGFTSRVRFYVYIKARGLAWVFEQENNPFNSDPWNMAENKKAFRKAHNSPYKLPNFLFEISYPDLAVNEKEAYLSIRNTKRVAALQRQAHEREERYSLIKERRDAWLKIALSLNKMLPKVKQYSQADMAELTGDSKALISMVSNGLR